jgi:hypothetical protein
MDIKSVHAKGISFADYLEHWPQAIKESAETELGDYVKINHSRTNRWVKRKPWRKMAAWQQLPGTGIDEEWLIITEYWCGDAAHVIPVLEDVAAVCGVQPSYIFRDEHPDVIDAFLTNGSRSIPKLIRLNSDTFEVIDVWGPRPLPAQNAYEQLKASSSDISMILEEMQKWYNENKGFRVLEEMVEQLKT